MQPAIGSLSQNVLTRQSAVASNPLNPETIVLALATVGMLLIALVAVGGFTVLAQRRLRSLGMLGALGATDRNIRLVVRANGVLVGVVGALAGTVLGLAAWLAYRPRLESSAHHLIGPFQLPWIVIGPAMALAVVATYFAASRPARAITRIPIVAALSGRPAPPKQVHRSALPGVVLFVIAAALLSYSGKSNGNGGGALELILGIVLLIVAIILLAPFCLVILASARAARPDRDTPGPARPGPLPGPVGLGPVGHQPRRLHRRPGLRPDRAAVRERPGLRRAERGLEPDHRVHTGRRPGRRRPGQRTGRIQPIRHRQHPAGPGGGRPEHRQGPRLAHRHRTRPGRRLAAARRGRAFLVRTGVRGHASAAGGLRDQGVRRQPRRRHPDHAARAVRPVRRCSSSTATQAKAAQAATARGTSAPTSYPCPKGQCLANPVIQQVSALPSGTSAPNTVITEHAIHALGLHTSASGWLSRPRTRRPRRRSPTPGSPPRAAGMTIETKSSTPSSAEILNYATAFGIALALGILAMTIGLIRSETARDLRTLAATGASSFTRRELTAATAFALALGGAVLGTVAAYVAAVGYAWDNPLDGLSELSSVPARQLLFIVVGMPVIAAVVGWLLAGREPSVMSRQPLE